MSLLPQAVWPGRSTNRRQESDAANLNSRTPTSDSAQSESTLPIVAPCWATARIWPCKSGLCAKLSAGLWHAMAGRRKSELRTAHVDDIYSAGAPDGSAGWNCSAVGSESGHGPSLEQLRHIMYPGADIGELRALAAIEAKSVHGT